MSKKILIVEDEASLLYALQTQLNVAGFETLVASDGETALSLIFKARPDLIVLDIIIPKIDGWALLQKIKSNKITKGIPVVIISNLSDDDSRLKGLELGAKDYLAKIDYSIADLVNKIKSISEL
ncbi:MAG TPA: response regulator [Patescibacteria group bacterium]|nr:response regulator [Patescibacteria group bacterium]